MVPTVLRREAIAAAHICCGNLKCVAPVPLSKVVDAMKGVALQNLAHDLGRGFCPDGPCRPFAISTLFFSLLVDKAGVEWIASSRWWKGKSIQLLGCLKQGLIGLASCGPAASLFAARCSK